MTRTTELLKGCNALKELNPRCECGTNGYLCDNCKSELRGRLDALKEEAKFLKYFTETKILLLSEDVHTRLLITEHLQYRLASIQEEIKLIEGKI